MTHFTWSIEQADSCPNCKGETLLLVAFGQMSIAEGDANTFQNKHYEEEGSVEIDEEISGHWCPECRKLVSLSFNAS